VRYHCQQAEAERRAAGRRPSTRIDQMVEDHGGLYIPTIVSQLNRPGLPPEAFDIVQMGKEHTLVEAIVQRPCCRDDFPAALVARARARLRELGFDVDRDLPPCEGEPPPMAQRSTDERS
jgi:hypothetical protein